LQQPGSGDPEIVMAKAKQNLGTRANDETASRLLNQLVAFPEEAVALAAHNIEYQKLSPEEKRRRKAQKATHYRWLQIQRLLNPYSPD